MYNDEHEPCRKEMRRIHDEGYERLNKAMNIKGIFLKKDTPNYGGVLEKLQITHVEVEPDGITIFVR